MIDVRSVACTATFMMEGALAVEQKHRRYGIDGRSTHDLYTVWDNGGVELHLELCQYAELAEKICQFVMSDEEYSFPRVFDYEVSEPFGSWFAEQLFMHGAAPAIRDATERLLRDIAFFFTQCKDEKEFAAGILFCKLKGQFNV